MKLSTRMRYGTRALVELAAAHPTRAVSVREMAGKMRVSAKYLERIMAIAKAAGIVVSVVGSRGGYRLARPPDAIRLSEVQTALGEPGLLACVSDPAGCSLSDTCPTRDVWIAVGDAISDVLDGVTLQDLLERRQRKERSRKRRSRGS